MREYFSKKMADSVTGLAHNIPLSDINGFDIHDIEQGRLYFWIKENKKDIFKSKLIFFILQDRANVCYLIVEDFVLSDFNYEYDYEAITKPGYVSDLTIKKFTDRTESLLDKIKSKGYKEISQERIIELLTGQNNSELLTQEPDFSIYTENFAYDVYKGMIQIWEWDARYMSYTTHFFRDKTQQIKFLEDDIEGQNIVKRREDVQSFIQWINDFQHKNTIYITNRNKLKKLFSLYPEIEETLSNADLNCLMESSNIKIIEGDHHISGDLELDSSAGSLFITGNFVVEGTLFLGTKCSKNFLCVLGDLNAGNYLHVSNAYKHIVYFKNVKVSGFSYLPQASRTSGINVFGKIYSKNLIQWSMEKSNDNDIIFEQYYSTLITAQYVNALFDKNGSFDVEKLYCCLINNKKIIVDINETELQNEKYCLAFKSRLESWGSLYYEFSGFKNLKLKEGKYGKNCYVGNGDEVLEDIRGKTGRYCMCHETRRLIPFRKNNKDKLHMVSPVDLAYRFSWIGWTFSNWEHRYDGPLDYWKNTIKIDQHFEQEKNELITDPHLALYWLLHFGLLHDPRYEEVILIMQDNNEVLIKEAMAFLKQAENIKQFSVKVNGKKNTDLVDERIKKNIMCIELDCASDDEKIAILMQQFVSQPKETVNLLLAINKLHNGTETLSAISNKPYQEGYSYLQILYGSQDIDKWSNIFLQECWEHIDTQKAVTPDGLKCNVSNSDKILWNNTNGFLELIESIFEDLSIINQDKAMTIIASCGALDESKIKFRLDLLIRKHKAKISGKTYSLEDDIKDYVANLESQELWVSTFAKTLKNRPPNEHNLIIKSAISQHKFSQKCLLEGTLCSLC